MNNDMNDDKQDETFEDELGTTPETETETETETENAALKNYAAAAPAPIKRGLGWGAVLPLFLLAAGGGAIGGWALTQYVMPNYIPLPQSAAQPVAAANVDLGPLRSRLEAAETKLSAQSSQLSFLSSEVKSGAASIKVGGVDKAFDVSPLLSRLDEMETRLENIGPPEGMKPKTGSAAETVLAEPNSNADTDTDIAVNANTAGEAPQFSEANLESLETRLAALETGLSEAAKGETPESAALDDTFKQELRDELESVRARVNQLETDISAAQALAAAPKIVRETVLLPPFPREALLVALTKPRDADSQGWLNRTLKKHISVRNPEDVARANQTLDEIESLTAAREYSAALALVEAMPSDVRSLAGEWTQAVKAEVETP